MCKLKHVTEPCLSLSQQGGGKGSWLLTIDIQFFLTGASWPSSVWHPDPEPLVLSAGPSLAALCPSLIIGLITIVIFTVLRYFQILFSGALPGLKSQLRLRKF